MGPGLTADLKTGRPLVGYAVFNEHFVRYDDGDYQAQVATFVHEVAHALFFHPSLFRMFPKNRRGQSFLSEEVDDVFRLRGNNVLRMLRTHFGCKRPLGGSPTEPPD